MYKVKVKSCEKNKYLSKIQMIPNNSTFVQ